MTMQMPQSTKTRAFVDARFVQARMISETVTSIPGRPSIEPHQIQINANVTSNMTVALNDPQKPTELFVEIEYNVALKRPEVEKQLLSYTAKHVSHFKIIDWTGFEDWGAIPQGALGPYFAIANALAQRRAERTLLDMGLRGIVRPRTGSDDYVETPAGGLTEESMSP
jgi:hypothetical protein